MTTASPLSGHQVLYGCMGLGGDWTPGRYRPEDVAEAEAAVEAALDSGITAFDHADIYRGGKSEAVFGEVLARSPGLRERIVIQTKCGIRLPDGDRHGLYDLRPGTIRRKVEESLTRLRTDVIDVLLLHRPDPLAGPAEVAEALSGLHAQGLVRAVGVSNMAAPQIAALQRHLDLPVVANQLEMSLYRRGWVEAGVLVNTAAAASVGFPIGTLEHCAEHGIQVQAWGSLAQGRYTGREQTPEEQATARLIRDLAAKKGTTPEAILLWWLQRPPVGVAPVIGTVNPGRIRACRDAVLREPGLDHDEWYALWVSARGGPLP